MASAPIIIAGAGIGGLTAALALARKGFRVEIFEREPNLDEIGAGIQLSPNASRVLISLGLADRLTPHIVSPSEIRIETGTGGALARIPIGDLAEKSYGAPYWVIHRADLQSVLLDAVHARPEITLALNADLDEFSNTSDGITARGWRDREDFSEYEPTDGHAFEARGLALIGADGLGSIMRHRIFNPSSILADTDPRYSGRTAWRASVSSADVAAALRAPIVRLWLGPRAHLVLYPIRSGTATNIVAITSDNRSRTGWAEPNGNPEEVLAHFPESDWSQAIRDLLAVPDIWSRWPLFDRPPIPRWCSGAATLLGDAAHPMLPFLAQGAAMAIEDAAVLADCLHASPNEVERALHRYERRRQPRTARAQRAARRNGLIYHLSGPAAAVRNYILRKMSGEPLLARFDWLYDWRPETDQG